MSNLPPLPFELGEEYREIFWRFFNSQEERFKLGERNIAEATAALAELGELSEKIQHETTTKSSKPKEPPKDICTRFLAMHRQTVVYGQMEAMGRLLKIFHANDVNVFGKQETTIGILSYMQEMSARLKPQNKQEAERYAALASEDVKTAQDSSGDESASVKDADSDSEGTKQLKAAQKLKQAMKRKAKRARQKAKKKEEAKQAAQSQPGSQVNPEASAAPASSAAAAASSSATLPSKIDLPSRHLLSKSLSDRRSTAQSHVTAGASNAQAAHVQGPKLKNKAAETIKQAPDVQPDAFAAQGLKSAVPRIPSLKPTPATPRGVADVKTHNEAIDDLEEQIEICASQFLEMGEEMKILINGISSTVHAVEKGAAPLRRAVQSMNLLLSQALVVNDFMLVAFQHLYQMRQFEALAAMEKQTKGYIKIAAPWTRTDPAQPSPDPPKEKKHDRRAPGQAPPPSYEEIEGRGSRHAKS